MPFNDGGAPSDEVVHKWLTLLQNTMKYVSLFGVFNNLLIFIIFE